MRGSYISLILLLLLLVRSNNALWTPLIHGGTSDVVLGFSVHPLADTNISALCGGFIYVGVGAGQTGRTGVHVNHVAWYWPGAPDGQPWQPAGAGTNDIVRDIHFSSDGKRLYAGGRFTGTGEVTLLQGTQPVFVAMNRVGYYDFAADAWRSLGAGVDDGDVTTIVSHGEAVYIGGTFLSAGGAASPPTANATTSRAVTPTSFLAVWNDRDQVWRAVNHAYTETTHYVWDLVIHNGLLYAGAQFAPNTTTVNELAVTVYQLYNSTATNSTNITNITNVDLVAILDPINGTVYSLEGLPDGSIVAGGDFGAAIWTDNNAWEMVGNPAANFFYPNVIYDMYYDSEAIELYAVGFFAGGHAAKLSAGGWQPMGQQLDLWAWAVEKWHGVGLVVGGAFGSFQHFAVFDPDAAASAIASSNGSLRNHLTVLQLFIVLVCFFFFNVN